MKQASKDGLKLALNKIFGIKTNPLFLWANEMGEIHMSRMRMGLSGLNAHRHKYKFIPSSSCTKYGARSENTIHFFLTCSSYAALRRELIRDLGGVVPEHAALLADHRQSSKLTELTNILIFGIGKVNIDKSIFDIVKTYITNTKRFT